MQHIFAGMRAVQGWAALPGTDHHAMSKRERLRERVQTRRATSYDVARAAGVSQSAVSRCFAPGARHCPKTRELVMKVAAELGYGRLRWRKA